MFFVINFIVIIHYILIFDKPYYQKKPSRGRGDLHERLLRPSSEARRMVEAGGRTVLSWAPKYLLTNYNCT